MICPQCKASKTTITDSRITYKDTCVRRRHKCLECGYRYTTYEMTKSNLFVTARRIAEEEIKDKLRDRVVKDIDVVFSQFIATD